LGLESPFDDDELPHPSNANAAIINHSSFFISVSRDRNQRSRTTHGPFIV